MPRFVEATANTRIQAALAGAERGTLAPGVAPGDGATLNPAGQSRDTVPPSEALGDETADRRARLVADGGGLENR